jgi:hypothetical protein
MLPLRLAWIFGFLSTREYDARCRQNRFGPKALESTNSALQRLERGLAEDRLAVVLVLLSVVILLYTYLNGPLLA